MNDFLSQTRITLSGAEKPRVAVLVDGENISPSMAGQIILKSCIHGDLIIRRVYGNAARLTAWDAAPGFRVMHSGTGKNATDILLSVEATSLILTKQADILVIAASDRDYTHVAVHLREAGHKVIGLGEVKAPEAFRKSCFKFVNLVAPKSMSDIDPTSIKATQTSEGTLEAKITALIATCGAGGMAITTLNVQMHKLHGIRISLEKEKSWREYLEARPEVFKCDPKSSDAHVRLF